MSRSLILGVGCRAGTSADDIEELARRVVSDAGLSWSEIGMVATVTHRLAEPGLVELARRCNAQLVGYRVEELAAVSFLPSPSGKVRRLAGTPGVAEPAAILASVGGTLIVPKQRSARTTIAIARRSAPTPRRITDAVLGG